MAKSRGATALTKLNPAFIGKPVSEIKRKSPNKSGRRDLPFVAPHRTPTNAIFWHVPASGGYFGGYETGKAMALTVLKALREDKSGMRKYGSCSLSQIIESFMVRFEEEGGVEMRNRYSDGWSDAFGSFRGQYIGFMNTMAEWISDVAKSREGDSLDALSEERLVECANAGLRFDSSAYLASLAD